MSDYYHERDQMTVEIPKLQERITALEAEKQAAEWERDEYKVHFERRGEMLEKRAKDAVDMQREFEASMDAMRGELRKAEQERDRLRDDHKAEVDHWVWERDRMHSRAIKAEAEIDRMKETITGLLGERFEAKRKAETERDEALREKKAFADSAERAKERELEAWAEREELRKAVDELKQTIILLAPAWRAPGECW